MSFVPDGRWQGCTVACIASGPSLTEADCEAVRHLPAIAVNNAGLPPMADWADIHYAVDGHWWQRHSEALEYDRLKIGGNGEFQGVHRIQTAGTYGFDDRSGVVRTGAHSGYQAIQVAAKLGAKRIILLGYDCQPDGEKAHFFGSHKDVSGLSDPQPHTYPHWRKCFATLAPELEKRGVDVVNCSRRTALTCFRQDTLESVLCTVPSS